MNVFRNAKAWLGRQVVKVYNYVVWNYKLHVYPLLMMARGKRPIIIYQMGKVASTSLYDSLIKSGYDAVYQVHAMNPMRIQKAITGYNAKNYRIPFHVFLGRKLYHLVIERKLPTKFITLVREPIGRNLSGFFENYDLYTGFRYEESPLTVDETINIFLNKHDQNYPLRWFDEEFKPVLDIDIYEIPFSPEQGFQRIQHGNVDLLILKVESGDKVIEQAIRGFLEDTDFNLTVANVGESKAYADTYKTFKD